MLQNRAEMAPRQTQKFADRPSVHNPTSKVRCEHSHLPRRLQTRQNAVRSPPERARVSSASGSISGAALSCVCLWARKRSPSSATRFRHHKPAASRRRRRRSSQEAHPCVRQAAPPPPCVIASALRHRRGPTSNSRDTIASDDARKGRSPQGSRCKGRQ